LALSCVVSAGICILAQLLIGLRLRQEAKEINNRRRLITDIVAARSAAAQAGRAGTGGQQSPTQHIANLQQQQAQLSRRPKLGTFLFGMQSLLSAAIMLILMTFNGWLILACSVGSAVGYHYFSKGYDLSSSNCH